MGNPDQQSGAVAALTVAAGGAAMRQILQYRHAALDNPVVGFTVEIGDETDSAGIVFAAGIIQADLHEV